MFRIGLDASRIALTTAKRAVVSSFATERAFTMLTSQRPSRYTSDFVARGEIRVTMLAPSTCDNQHRGRQFYSVKVKGVGKDAVRVHENATVIVDGVPQRMRDFYASIIAL